MTRVSAVGSILHDIHSANVGPLFFWVEFKLQNKPDVWLLLQMYCTDILVVLEDITPVRGGCGSVCSSTVSCRKNIWNPQSSCEPGWMSFQSSCCYLISSKTSSWSQVEQQCASHGGHLRLLDTMQELVGLFYTCC